MNNHTQMASAREDRERAADERVTLPLANVRALVQLGWELTNYISETDKSATGSIYGIEHAHKTIARVAVALPADFAKLALVRYDQPPTPQQLEDFDRADRRGVAGC